MKSVRVLHPRSVLKCHPQFDAATRTLTRSNPQTT
jgi:hypothetical protein